MIQAVDVRAGVIGHLQPRVHPSGIIHFSGGFQIETVAAKSGIQKLAVKGQAGDSFFQDMREVVGLAEFYQSGCFDYFSGVIARSAPISSSVPHFEGYHKTSDMPSGCNLPG